MKLKKKIASISLAVLFTGAVAFNMQMNADQNQTQTSEITKENIEALTASAEGNPDQLRHQGGSGTAEIGHPCTYAWHRTKSYLDIIYICPGCYPKHHAADANNRNMYCYE